MSSVIDKNCTFLISTEKSGSIAQEEICKDIESSDIATKIRYIHFFIFAPNYDIRGLDIFNNL